MNQNQRLLVFQTCAIGAFLANEAKQLHNQGCLKSINETLALPLGQIRQLNLQTQFSSFSVNFHAVIEKHLISLGQNRKFKPINLPSELIIPAAINAGILINSKTDTYTDGIAVAEKLSSLFLLSKTQTECFVFIAALVDLLLDEGYFRYKHIQTLLNFHIGSEKLHRALDYIFKFSQDRDFILRAIVDPNVIKELAFEEAVIAKAVFYILQTFEIRDHSKIPGRKPKFLASNLMTISDPYIEDTILLYGAIFAASDHYTTLFRKPFFTAFSDLLPEFSV